jgi:hypothetical protein
MADLAVLNMPASLDDFEPVHVSDCLAGLRNRCADRFFDTCLGRTYNFNYLVDVIFHSCPPDRIKTARRDGPLRYLGVAVASLVAMIFRIFPTITGGQALLTGLAGLGSAALLLTRFLTRTLVLLAGLVLVRHVLSFHGNIVPTARTSGRS